MSNRVWLDVYDNETLLRLGEGPVFSVVRASISRPLDGAGSFRASVVATDARALTLLQTNRIVRIWGEDTAGIRLRGEGLIANYRLSETPGGVGLQINGPDILEELKRKNTLLGRIYNQETLQDVCDDLITLAPGWAVDVDVSIASEVIDARFDGVSLFKAFAQIVKRYGIHMRSSLSATRTLEISPFGQSNGLRIHKVETINTEALANPKLLMVQDITQDKVLESNNYFKVLMPTAAGEGTAALTLREAYEENGNGGRTYPIQLITGPDGRTMYYISTTTYPSGGYADFREDPGAAVKVGQYKDIAPLSNSVADRRNASEALYTAGVADLERSSVEQVAYSVTVRNVKENILPGDTIRLDYKAQVEIPGHLVDETELLTYLDVRGDFVILKADESISAEGTSTDLEISNLDKFEQDEIELIFDVLDSMEIRNLKPNIAAGPPSAYVYVRNMDSSNPANIPFEFTNAVLELLRVRMRIVTRNYVATSQGAASGGGSATIPGHKHQVIGPMTGPFGTPGSFASGQMRLDSGTGFSVLVGYSGSPPSNGLYTFDSSGGSVALPNHTHPVAFGLSKDTQYPQSVTLWFNGVDVTNDLFGVAALATSGGALNVLADAGALADLFTDAGLQQQHSIEVRCASGRGELEVTVEVFATTQAISLS